MSVKKLLFPLLISVVLLTTGSSLKPGGTLKTSSQVSGVQRASRTMPPSDPKPDGPKKPRRDHTYQLA